MPANLDDPASPTVYRTSGEPPYPGPDDPAIPRDVVPRQVTLRDRQTVATVVPFTSREQLPPSLGEYLCVQLNKEIDGGDTYPMIDRFTPDGFTRYWFQNFGAVMLLGDIESADHVQEGKDWAKECLGSFYIKPNYPGRSSHVCNAGFLVTDAARNRGVGRLMGEAYIDWAPRLGYTYSVFNLVYETNVASCRIWDALGFKRIGRVKGCGNLKSYPGRLVDAIIYGRDLAPGESEDLVSEERFDKIKFYLKYGKYPNGADRAEKSRLRSAATHYKLVGDDDKLMLKDKEVISDPAKQYEIARGVHMQQHAGINRTTATIAEKYHWSRIKEMVSDVIRNCGECKDAGKTPVGNHVGTRTFAIATAATTTQGSNSNHMEASAMEANSGDKHMVASPAADGDDHTLDESLMLISALSRPTDGTADDDTSSYGDSSALAALAASEPSLHHHHNPMLQDQPLDHFPSPPSHHFSATSSYDQQQQAQQHQQPIDPQIIHHITSTNSANSGSQQPSTAGVGEADDQHTFDQYQAHFQALLNATEEDDDDIVAARHQQQQQRDNAVAAAEAVDRDLDMLIEQHDDDDGSGEARMTGIEDGTSDGTGQHKVKSVYGGTYGST
ncbi:his(2)-Cys(2) zinc finger domain-containing protein [Sarocladium implicatum]|nr:his(2)-Cys(2) zinc finger domain-containing protein [Sarocladium implicatum]